MKKRIIMGMILSTIVLSSQTLNVLAEEQEEINLTDDIVSSCEYYGSMFGICPELLEAIIWAESRGITTAQNDSCIGICQINTSNQSTRLKKNMNIVGCSDKLDVDVQVRTMCDLLYELSYGEYADEQQDIALTLAMYHGEKNAKAKLEKGIMSDYVTDILDLSEQLEILHNKK